MDQTKTILYTHYFLSSAIGLPPLQSLLEFYWYNSRLYAQMTYSSNTANVPFMIPISFESLLTRQGMKSSVFDHKWFLGILSHTVLSICLQFSDLQASKKALDPVAPLHKYCIVSVSNILTTTCQYEASFIFFLMVTWKWSKRQRRIHIVSIKQRRLWKEKTNT